MKPQPKLRGFFSSPPPSKPKPKLLNRLPMTLLGATLHGTHSVNTKPPLKLRSRPEVGTLSIKVSGTKVTVVDDGYLKPRPRILNREPPDGKTDWYPGNLKPMYVGVYEREGPNPEYPYSWWNGVFWCLGGRTPDEAVKPVHQRLSHGPQPKWFVCPSSVQNARWRGLTREHASEERAHNAPN